jgi:hypothetical protein
MQPGVSANSLIWLSCHVAYPGGVGQVIRRLQKATASAKSVLHTFILAFIPYSYTSSSDNPFRLLLAISHPSKIKLPKALGTVLILSECVPKPLPARSHPDAKRTRHIHLRWKVGIIVSSRQDTVPLVVMWRTRRLTSPSRNMAIVENASNGKHHLLNKEPCGCYVSLR